MAQAELGSFQDTAGVDRPVVGMALVKPNGDSITLDGNGYTPWEAAVIASLTSIAASTAASLAILTAIESNTSPL